MSLCMSSLELRLFTKTAHNRFAFELANDVGGGEGEKAVRKIGGFKFTPTKTGRFDLTAYVGLTPPIYTVPQFIPSPHSTSFHAIPDIFRAGFPRA